VHAGSGGRVDSQAPLIHAGALRRSESAPFLELLLVDFARAKSGPGECRGGCGGASRRWGIILDFCAKLSAHPASGWDPNKWREQRPALHRTQSPDAWLRHPGQDSRWKRLPKEDLRELHRSLRGPGVFGCSRTSLGPFFSQFLSPLAFLWTFMVSQLPRRSQSTMLSDLTRMLPAPSSHRPGISRPRDGRA
jgi:hypothetical protein